MLTFFDYYSSLVHTAFSRTMGIAKLEEFPLTLLFAVLGAGCYLLWRRFIDRSSIGEWKPLVFAAVAPVTLVFCFRFFWNAASIPIERQQAAQDGAQQEIADLKSQNIATLQRTEIANQNAKDSLNQKITTLSRSLSRADEAQTFLHQRLVEAGGKIARSAFITNYLGVWGEVQTDTSVVDDLDPKLKAYQERFAKHLVPYSPMWLAGDDQKAHAQLTVDQANFDKLEAQWNSILAATVCTGGK